MLLDWYKTFNLLKTICGYQDYCYALATDSAFNHCKTITHKGQKCIDVSSSDFARFVSDALASYQL